MENAEKKQKVDTIIVISPTKQMYDTWRFESNASSIEESGNLKYRCVLSVQDIEGRDFISVVKLTGWWKLKDADLIEKVIEVRMDRKHKHYEEEQGE